MKTSPIFKILSVAVLVAVVLMFGIQSYRYVTDPFTTTLAYNSQAEETIPVNGWLVRQEEILSDVPGTLYHYLEEGEKVGVGQTIATAYSSENALQTVAQLEEQELRLQQLQFALTSYLNPDAALKLDSSITEGILSLRGHLSQGDYASADEAVSQLKAAILKRSHTYSSAAFFAEAHNEGGWASSLAMAQTMHGNVLIGETTQGYSLVEEKHWENTSPIHCKEIPQRVKNYFPELAKVKVIRSYTASSPFTDSCLPVFGKTSVSGLLVAAGFKSTVVMTPMAGRIMADLVTKDSCDYNLKEFIYI